MIWVTDDEPENLGPTRTMHRLLRKYDSSRPILNLSPWMPPAIKMPPHMEIPACDFYVHSDSSGRQWDMQDKFEKLYRLNPAAITMFVGDTTVFCHEYPLKPFQREGRPDPGTRC